jgi:hypothetical protein
MRRGYRTTEFWLTIAIWILPILMLIFHKNLSSLAVPLATLAAGIANSAYTISRALIKNGHANAVTSTTGPAAAQSPVDAATISTWVANMTGAVEALTAALAATTTGRPTQQFTHQPNS